jgi:hypothetical protein
MWSGNWDTSIELIPGSSPLLESFSSSLWLEIDLGALTLESTSQFSESGFASQGFAVELRTGLLKKFHLDVQFRPAPPEFTAFSFDTRVAVPASLTGIPMEIELNWAYHYGKWNAEAEMSADLAVCRVRIDTYFGFSDSCTLLFESAHIDLSGLTFECLEVDAYLKMSCDEGFESLEVATCYSPDDSLLSWFTEVELGTDDLYIELTPSLNLWTDQLSLGLDVTAGSGTGAMIEGLRIESLHASCSLGSSTLRLSHSLESGKTSLSLRVPPLLSCSATFRNPGGLFSLHDVRAALALIVGGRVSVDLGLAWRAPSETELTVSVDVPF